MANSENLYGLKGMPTAEDVAAAHAAAGRKNTGVTAIPNPAHANWHAATANEAAGQGIPFHTETTAPADRSVASEDVSQRAGRAPKPDVPTFGMKIGKRAPSDF